MSNHQIPEPAFPVFFGGIIAKSFVHYKDSFLNYLVLTAITFLPFVIVERFSALNISDFTESLHGHFLDILIFLTFPTVFMKGKVFPFATIQLFFQRFFASAVLISFAQLGTLLFFVTFFAQISIGAVLVGMIPYIFLLFAGMFLIMENADRVISVRSNLINSMRLVKNRFFPIFWYFLIITLLTMLPLFAFSVWFLGNHPQFVIFVESLANSSEVDPILGQNLINLVQSIINEPFFIWGRAGIHVLFRPIKSIFICYLFIGIMNQLNPGAIRRFLGLLEREDDASSPQEIDPSIDERVDDNDETIH